MVDEVVSPRESLNPKREILELVGYILVYAILTALVTLFAGLAIGGFEEAEFLKKFQFYYWGIIFVVAVVVMKIGEIITKGKYVEAVIHDPEQPPSLFRKPPEIVKNPLKFFLLCFGVTLVVGMFFAMSNTFFAATPQIIVEQQVSEVSKVWFGVEPAVTAETLGLFAFLIAIALTLPKLLSKGKISKGLYYVICYGILPIAVGAMWTAYHGWRYGGLEVSLVQTFMFGYVSAMLTMLFHSMIPAWCLHFNNNLFFVLNKLYSDELIVIFTIIFIIVGAFVVFIISAITKGAKKGKGG